MRKIVVASVLALVVLAAAGYCLAQAGAEATTKPAKDMLSQILDQATNAGLLAKWACILSGLALAGVIWIVWNMQTLARNQVALAKLIQKK